MAGNEGLYGFGIFLVYLGFGFVVLFFFSFVLRIACFFVVVDDVVSEVPKFCSRPSPFSLIKGVLFR